MRAELLRPGFKGGRGGSPAAGAGAWGAGFRLAPTLPAFASLADVLAGSGVAGLARVWIAVLVTNLVSGLCGLGATLAPGSGGLASAFLLARGADFFSDGALATGMAGALTAFEVERL